MARHYSSKDFSRQMPNALLARYFQRRGLFADVDFAAMKEGRPDELFTAWLALSDSQRNAMEAEFRDIFELSCEKGFRAIIDEASWQLLGTRDDLTSFIEMLSALPNHYERAFENWLIDNHISYTRSDERRRLGPSEGSVKNFDFLLCLQTGRQAEYAAAFNAGFRIVINR